MSLLTNLYYKERARQGKGVVIPARAPKGKSLWITLLIFGIILFGSFLFTPSFQNQIENMQQSVATHSTETERIETIQTLIMSDEATFTIVREMLFDLIRTEQAGEK